MGATLNSESLLDLAKSRSPGDRERLLLAVVELCDGDGSAARVGPGVEALLASVLMSLVVEAERDMRRRLAEKLAGIDWAPPALINVLALDEIEIARQIIARSPVLKDTELVRLLLEATLEHQIEVARRPGIGAPVVAAILDRADPAVMTALAGNVAADLSEADMGRLVDAARRVTGLRSPLSRHPKLSSELALRLYVWVGGALRQALAERFRLDRAALDRVVAETVQEAHAGVADGSPHVEVMARQAQQEEMERRLLDKLHAAGQLRPGYLVCALREQRLSLFVTALAMLGRFEARHVSLAVDCDQPELLALACAAVGIDRSVFPTILELVRQLNGGRPGGGAEGARRAAGAFAPVTPQVAGAAFRHASDAA